jgi:alcohol-forming fatty acyl-CoA reductase
MASDPAGAGGDAPLRARLAGRRVLVTGVTGFIGQAVLSRLLADFPEVRVTALIRGRDGWPAADRLAGLLRSPVCAPVREAVGSEAALDALLGDRLDVVEGELGATAPALPDDLDAVIHCAATVSFDPPIDEGFTINLPGPQALYEAVHASGSRAHLVHVSTAYVAGVRKGVVPEGPLDHDVDWRAELDAALAARPRSSGVPAPGAARPLHRRVARRAPPRRPADRAADAEERRRSGSTSARRARRARAHSLGWPDVYTLTKALGERAAEEIAAGDLPLSIVRPSIVESALAWPYPGWIEGFKMAEPIILAYGRGALPEFPASPTAWSTSSRSTSSRTRSSPWRRPPRAGGLPAYYHVSSAPGTRCTFAPLRARPRAYFQPTRCPIPIGGRSRCPSGSSPAAHGSSGCCGPLSVLVEFADRAVSTACRARSAPGDPVTKAHRGSAARVRPPLRRPVRRLRRGGGHLHRRCGPRPPPLAARRRPGALRLRRGRIDWRHYLQSTCTARASRRCCAYAAAARSAPAVTVVGRPNGGAAVFDLEGTILTPTSSSPTCGCGLPTCPPWSAWPGSSPTSPGAAPLPRRRPAGPRAFLRSFYRRYEGASVEGLARLVDDHVADLLLAASVPAAIRRVREHRAAGHRTMLITGALEPLVAPLRRCSTRHPPPARRRGRALHRLPRRSRPWSARPAPWLRSRHAAATGIDLPPATATATATRTCRCSRPSATPWR